MDAFLFIKGTHLHLRISERRSGKWRMGLLLLCCRWNITILKKARLGCEICFGWFCGVIDSGLSIYYLGEENGGCYWRIEFLYFRTILSGVVSSILLHETWIRISLSNPKTSVFIWEIEVGWRTAFWLYTRAVPDNRICRISCENPILSDSAPLL